MYGRALVSTADFPLSLATRTRRADSLPTNPFTAEGLSVPNSNTTQRLTVGQAVVQFLAAQRVERDGDTQPFFGGAIGIFGHGNVAGIGQALLQYRKDFRLYQARNEQGMVHMATGYAKAKNRLGALACSSSIGPGATNMITGAATATVNRLPVLCLPSDIFASRRTGAVLQQLESSFSWDSSASDAFKPVSKYWDRINRPDQLPTALLEAMRTLTSPADTGAVTISLPQDVQAEAWDFPTALFRERTWHVPRARADRAALRRAAQVIGAAKRPVVIAGGGVIYSARQPSSPTSWPKLGSRLGQRRPARPACRTTTRRWSTPWAPVARCSPTPSRTRPTSLSASAPATPTSRPPRTRCSPTRTSNSSTSTSPSSTRTKSQGLPSSATPARPSLNLPTCSPTTPSRSPTGPRWKRPPTSGATRWIESSNCRMPPPCLRAKRSGSSTRSPATTTWATTRSVPCRGTCTGSGGLRIPRPTTWSTATPAWATRSRGLSAPRWPIPAATSSASLATAPSSWPVRRP